MSYPEYSLIIGCQFYPSPEMRSVYSTAPADRAISRDYIHDNQMTLYHWHVVILVILGFKPAFF